MYFQPMRVKTLLLHGVIPTQNSGRSKYVTCQLQTEAKMIKAICFPPEKIAPLRSAINEKSHVEIKK